jgi:hypothetical protein
MLRELVHDPVSEEHENPARWPMTPVLRLAEEPDSSARFTPSSSPQK